MKRRLEILENSYPQLAEKLRVYPQINSIDSIEGSLSPDTIIEAAAEVIGDFSLSDDLIFHFSNIAEVEFADATLIGLGCLELVEIEGKSYCIIGDYNKHSDGDKIAVLSNNPQIFYLCHETNSAELLCDNIEEFFERELSSQIDELYKDDKQTEAQEPQKGINFGEVMQKYSMELALCVGLFLGISVMVGTDGDFSEVLRLYYAIFPLTLTFVYFANRLSQSRASKELYGVGSVVAIGLAVTIGILLPRTPLTLLAIPALLWWLICGGKDDKAFVRGNLMLFRANLITYAIWCVVALVIAIIAATLQTLFDISIDIFIDFSLPFFYILLFGMCVGLPLIFFYTLDAGQAKLQHSSNEYNWLRVILQYILSPSIVIYAIILYTYGAKIVKEGVLPDGGVAYMVFGFTLLYFVGVALSEVTRKGFFTPLYKAFGFVALPPLTLFWTGVAHRIGEYGITEGRAYLALCGGIMTLAVLMRILPKLGTIRRVVTMALILCGVVSVVPQLDPQLLTLNSQYAIARECATELGALTEDGKIHFSRPLDRDYPPVETAYNKLYSAVKTIYNLQYPNNDYTLNRRIENIAKEYLKTLDVESYTDISEKFDRVNIRGNNPVDAIAMTKKGNGGAEDEYVGTFAFDDIPIDKSGGKDIFHPEVFETMEALEKAGSGQHFATLEGVLTIMYQGEQIAQFNVQNHILDGLNDRTVSMENIIATKLYIYENSKVRVVIKSFDAMMRGLMLYFDKAEAEAVIIK